MWLAGGSNGKEKMGDKSAQSSVTQESVLPFKTAAELLLAASATKWQLRTPAWKVWVTQVHKKMDKWDCPIFQQSADSKILERMIAKQKNDKSSRGGAPPHLSIAAWLQEGMLCFWHAPPPHQSLAQCPRHWMAQRSPGSTGLVSWDNCWSCSLATYKVGVWRWWWAGASQPPTVEASS